MNKPKNWILGAGVVLLLGFGGKILAVGGDIPDGLKAVLLVILTAGLGGDAITTGIQKFINKPEADK